jgi:hypothetical protein
MNISPFLWFRHSNPPLSEIPMSNVNAAGKGFLVISDAVNEEIMTLQPLGLPVVNALLESYL